jgi:hypothetical protein
MNRARPTFQKRERERSKRERQQQKLQRRADAKARKAEGGSGMDDSDIAHIVPGPQPPQED